MSAPKLAAAVLSVLLVSSAFAPAASAGAVASNQQETYAGTHVSFDTTSDAVVDYTVGSETVLESVKVQSKSETENSGSLTVGAELSAVSGIDGSTVSIDSRAETSASVTAESGAELRAHDNSRGILTVRAGESSQYVTADVSSSSQAERESGDRVVVTTENGTQGAFVVVGDGEVTVNDRGNVSAELAEDSRLVFRTYTDGRGEDDEKQERMISNGTAAAEVYVMESGEGSSEPVADVVQYDENTTVEVTQRGQGTVNMTVERSAHRGKVLITSVSDSVLDTAGDVRVSVDGEAAARASTYGELQRASDGGDVSKFMLRQGSNADASADVLVAVNHFSERQITMQEIEASNPEETATTTATDGGTATVEDGGDSDGSTDTVGEATSTTSPGFGVVITLVALFGAAFYASRER